MDELTKDDTLIFLILAFFAFLLLVILIRTARSVRIRRKIKRLAKNALEVTPKQFFKLRNAASGRKGRKSILAKRDFAGVYILYNHTKKMYYVGQGQKVFQRVNNHFTGHGNGDVYADYKYGDRFTIRMIALKRSGFKTLNELERNAIQVYDAYSKGYNKTRGNKG